MFEEKIEYDVTAKASGHIEVRRSDIVLKSGTEIARTYHRHVVTPGDNVTGEIETVQALAALWTQEQIEAVRSFIENELTIG